MTSTNELLTRRRRHISDALSLHYGDRPLHIVRGEGAYLYDADGRQYLDCVNNVPQVGHAHPEVAAAAHAQLAAVNTNTRYLYEPLVDYVERLTALLPDPLRVCFLVNSGSEANDLALRLARTHTGRTGAVVLDGAYHGHTGSVLELSPYKFDGAGGAGRPPHVQVAPTPDPFRGEHRDADAGARYAAEVATACASAREAGFPAAAFFCEPILGCAGQVVPPTDFLAPAFEAARAAGAVCVADEVQIGLGRLGHHTWGFEAHGVVPDIVTLGKPIGNGFPLGAVVTTPEIAASFANGMEYFNTFGGSTASCAVGLAVLDVMAREGLQAHARDVGAHLAAGFTELATRHAAIGDVRGSGLFLGVDLVTDRDARTPAGPLARAIAAGARDEGVLLSTEGPGDNVLKIKPPLPFSMADADRLLETVDGLLERGERGEPGGQLAR